MATVRSDKSTTMTLKLETGTTEAGNTKYTNRSISRVNPGLSDANALQIWQAVGELQKWPVNAVVRNDKASLISA